MSHFLFITDACMQLIKPGMLKRCGILNNVPYQNYNSIYRLVLILSLMKDLRCWFTMTSVSMYWTSRWKMYFHKYILNWIFQACNCSDIGFGSVDEILLCKQYDQHFKFSSREILHTADMLLKALLLFNFTLKESFIF